MFRTLPLPLPLRRPLVAGLLITLASGFAHSADTVFTVTPDKATGVYTPEEKVTWTVDVKGDRGGLTALPYKVKKDAQGEVASGTIDLSSGPAIITASRAEAGALLAQIFSMDTTKPLPVAMGGAVISPGKLGPAVPAPEDFDAFWQAKLKELSDVPPNPVVEKVNIEGVKNAEGMECYKVTLDNIRGTHARGILAKPAGEGKYPAMLLVNSAGVYALDKAQVIAYAKSGWIVLNVSAHDLPVDEAEAYYKELKENSLKNYFYLGSEDRETSYFLRMFLGCVRGAEYLTTRPDWDGRTLIVTGASQGGLQAFAAAALFPKITAVMANVPAGCDNHGPLANPPRAFGWPYWMSKVGTPPRDLEKATKTAGYFEGISFAARIHCPTLIGVALLDIAARPAGVIAAFNAIDAPKELLIMPVADHHGSGGSQALYFNTFAKWREALKKGQPLPIKPPQA
jgi:cephalosporin-C deacetylase